MVERRIYMLGDEALGLVIRTMSQPTKIGGPGDGDGGGQLGSRLAKVEACVEHIQSDLGEAKKDIRDLRNDTQRDFRILFGAIIVVALGLASLIAKGFKWL
jgi:hypothetical protein